MHLKMSSAKMAAILSRSQCIKVVNTNQTKQTIVDILNEPQYAPFHLHDDVIQWKHLPRYWPFVRGIHRSAVNSPHKGQWRGDLMFSLICAWTNSRVNNRDAGNYRSHRAHYDVIVMDCSLSDCNELQVCQFVVCEMCGIALSSFVNAIAVINYIFFATPNGVGYHGTNIVCNNVWFFLHTTI